MDVLKPPIIRIGNRCYRKNPSLQRDINTAEEEEEGPTETVCWNDEVCDAHTNIEETDNGFRVTLEIPSAYFKYIIGKKGETRRRLETETRTQIKIPSVGVEGDIVVLGHDRNGVLSAKTRIDIMVESARQREPFTHFLSYPINGRQITNRFEEFKSDVLRECDGDRGLDGTIFQNPSKLHLTIGTLVLLNDTEKHKALDMLSECRDDLIVPILKGEPVLASIHGLEYMNDDPSAVDVLYAKVNLDHNYDRLQILVDRLVEKFTSSGLMQRDYDHVKLHVTVMNTLMRKDPSGTSLPSRQDKKGSFKDRESFDASNILKKFGSFDFGSQHLGKLHLSQRYSTGEDGYYARAGTVDMP